MQTIKFMLQGEDDDGYYEEERELPARWEICTTCRGEGHTSNHLGAFTSSEWNELDHEWQEDYIDGKFDRACEHCNGAGKVLVADEERCDPELLKEYWAHQAELAELHAIERQERLMAGGWREEGWYGN